MAVSVFVSGAVSPQEVLTAQNALRDEVSGAQVDLIPLDLDLALDVGLVLSAVSTLTSVAAFVRSLLQEKRESSATPAGPREHDPAAEVEPDVFRDEGGAWVLTFRHDGGAEHIVTLRPMGAESFEAEVRSVEPT